jgi:hypothetical protein
MLLRANRDEFNSATKHKTLCEWERERENESSQLLKKEHINAHFLKLIFFRCFLAHFLKYWAFFFVVLHLFCTFCTELREQKKTAKKRVEVEVEVSRLSKRRVSKLKTRGLDRPSTAEILSYARREKNNMKSCECMNIIYI